MSTFAVAATMLSKVKGYRTVGGGIPPPRLFFFFRQNSKASKEIPIYFWGVDIHFLFFLQGILQKLLFVRWTAALLPVGVSCARTADERIGSACHCGSSRCG